MIVCVIPVLRCKPSIHARVVRVDVVSAHGVLFPRCLDEVLNTSSLQILRLVIPFTRYRRFPCVVLLQAAVVVADLRGIEDIGSGRGAKSPHPAGSMICFVCAQRVSAPFHARVARFCGRCYRAREHSFF